MSLKERENEFNEFVFYLKAPTFGAVNNHIYKYNSFEKLEFILAFRQRMGRRAWLKLLGEQWSNCDNIGFHSEELRKYLPEKASKNMMSDEEFKAFCDLPDLVKIYRGCGLSNQNGLSWSLQRDVAEALPFQNKYKQDLPILLVAEVKKSSIIALKLERQEFEVIVNSPQIIEQFNLTKRK
ncbi:MAG: hypothetical protein HOP25_02775 [Methylotenera sp.]|nr:hypothetical protein [Methylotenera sp.]